MPTAPPTSVPWPSLTDCRSVSCRCRTGSAYPAIASDVLARYAKLRGADVHYVTGMDEHGEKIAQTAVARLVEECMAFSMLVFQTSRLAQGQQGQDPTGTGGRFC